MGVGVMAPEPPAIFRSNPQLGPWRLALNGVAEAGRLRGGRRAMGPSEQRNPLCKANWVWECPLAPSSQMTNECSSANAALSELRLLRPLVYGVEVVPLGRAARNRVPKLSRHSLKRRHPLH